MQHKLFMSQVVCLHCRYDDLRNYSNERSIYLAQLRNSIEEPWQQWELAHFDIEAYKSKSLDEVVVSLYFAFFMKPGLPAMSCVLLSLFVEALCTFSCTALLPVQKTFLVAAAMSGQTSGGLCGHQFIERCCPVQ